MLDARMTALSLAELSKPYRGRSAAAASARWILLVLASTALIWLAGLAALLAVAQRVHVDVPRFLAVKLPLLKDHPPLIFAGESRNMYGADPVLAARLLGQPRGYAVNIAFEAAEPLATLGAMRLKPEAFRGAHVVVSVAPFNFNGGTRQAYVYPLNVAARLPLGELMAMLPMRVGTLTRFVQEAFYSRLMHDVAIADTSPVPANLGFSALEGQRAAERWSPRVSAHPHFTGWTLDGPRARMEIDGLCEMVKLTRALTVVLPPWAARYDRARDPDWRRYDEELAARIGEAGRRCGFDVLDIQSVPGLTDAQFFDDMHVNAQGVPLYTRYLVEHLRR